MTILITGVTGLVGERLVPRLVSAGHHCRVLVRPGKRPPAGGEPVTGDILDPATLAEAVRGVTSIVHLAAVFRTQDTDLIWRSNVEGTRNLIEAVKAVAPTARFILSSTSNVYRPDNGHPGREDDPVEPSHAYPASKVVAENALRDSGLTWSILRFPFVYGDGDGHLEALPGHIASWHPAQKMSTIHHRDIAAAMDLTLKGIFDGRVVNIADEAPLSVYELAGLAGTTLASNAEPLSNPWHLHVDTSLARSLGFHPSVRTVFQAMQENLL
ncbi:NAD(P)-dependent oxidoreductase [Pseudomonas sp. R2.Fl]|nr:NAD(P)-dependent oxidoreductase [Pseudomonas sp. R2.Fl]